MILRLIFLAAVGGFVLILLDRWDDIGGELFPRAVQPTAAGAAGRFWAWFGACLLTEGRFQKK